MSENEKNLEELIKKIKEEQSLCVLCKKNPYEIYKFEELFCIIYKDYEGELHCTPKEPMQLEIQQKKDDLEIKICKECYLNLQDKKDRCFCCNGKFIEETKFRYAKHYCLNDKCLIPTSKYGVYMTTRRTSCNVCYPLRSSVYKKIDIEDFKTCKECISSCKSEMEARDLVIKNHGKSFFGEYYEVSHMEYLRFPKTENGLIYETDYLIHFFKTVFGIVIEKDKCYRIGHEDENIKSIPQFLRLDYPEMIESMKKRNVAELPKNYEWFLDITSSKREYEDQQRRKLLKDTEKENKLIKKTKIEKE